MGKRRIERRGRERRVIQNRARHWLLEPLRRPLWAELRRCTPHLRAGRLVELRGLAELHRLLLLLKSLLLGRLELLLRLLELLGRRLE